MTGPKLLMDPRMRLSGSKMHSSEDRTQVAYGVPVGVVASIFNLAFYVIALSIWVR